MQWKHLFPRTILERGGNYYRSKSVSGYRKQGNWHSAWVYGTRSYKVQVLLIDEQVVHMSCTCPYAKDGNRCKHMAAFFYYLEANHVVELEEKVPLGDVAPMKAQEGYSYFDCAAMKQPFMLPKSRIGQIQGMIKDGMVALNRVETGYRRDDHTLSAIHDEVEGNAYGKVVQNNKSYLLSLHFDRKHILEANCNAPDCNWYYSSASQFGKRTICVHQAALLLLLEEYMNTYNPGDFTSRGGSAFLDCYQGKKAAAVMSKMAAGTEVPLNLTLKPRLQIFRTEWSLSFKIGNKKMFVLKDLPKFAEQVEKNEVVQFGSSTEWPMGIDNFSEQGKKLVKFICQIVREEEERKSALGLSNAYRYGSKSEIEDSIPLFGRRLDDFFKVMEHETIEVNRGYGKEKTVNMVTCREKTPEIQLKIENMKEAGEGFQGIRVSGKVPDMLHSPEAVYYVEDDYINRISADELRELNPLLSVAQDGEIEFNIGRKRLGEFYYNVLPWLKKHAHVVEEDMEEIAPYLPPEVKFAFYLDLEDQNIVCRAEMEYGEWKKSLCDTYRILGYNNVAKGRVEEFRDVNREAEALMQVQSIFPYVDEEMDVFHCAKDEEVMYRALRYGIEELIKLGDVHVSERLKRLNVSTRPNLSVGVSVDSQVLNLTVASEDISPQELLEILYSYKRRKRFHRLKNGDFLDLAEEKETMEMLEQLLESLKIPVKDFVRGKMQIPVYRALYLDKMLEECSGAYVKRDRTFKALVKDFKTVVDADFDVPEPLQKTLRNYQETGYRWLRTLDSYGFGGILADEMGLGKTLQVITMLLAVKRNRDAADLSDQGAADSGKAGPALIVTPASLVYNWDAEFKKFAPELDVCLVTGSQAERRRKLQERQSHDVILTSYDLLKRDIAEYESHEYSFEILDEAQYIKNHVTAAAKAVKIIKSRQRFALTGTPIENRLSELWSIFDYLMPGYLYSYEVFKRDFETPIVKNHDTSASERLKRMVSPFILRRLKEQVLKDLPDKLEEVHYVKLEDAQRKLLDGQVTHMRTLLDRTDEAEFSRNKLRILAELTRIRQICCDPSLCFENYHGGSAKREACVELLQNAVEGGHKVLVFSQFTTMLELLEHDLHQKGIEYYKITGSTPKEERVRLVNAFNQDQIPVFLISLKAGGTGLNLTGADIVIHYDPWWNLAAQNQATDRAHRIGQTKVVTVCKMIVKDSIEEKIQHMQETKKSLADEILSGENGLIGSMSKEELLELL